jgi:PAS domain S-box-containing protein
MGGGVTRSIALSDEVLNLVDGSPLGIHSYALRDGALVFEYANRAADEILGIDNDEFVGKTIEEAFPPLADTEVPDRYRAAARDGTPWRTEQIEYGDGDIKGAFAVTAFQIAPGHMAATFEDITERKRLERDLRSYRDHLEDLVERRTVELRAANAELQASLERVRTLSGLLPICAWCKKIRNDNGFWERVEDYIREHSLADFSHGVCPECAEAVFKVRQKKPPVGD